VWNASASVPLGLYRITPDARPLIGELVAVRPSPELNRFMAERQYVEANALLVKPVAALAGARICRNGARVTIDARTVAAALPRDRFGRALPRWSGCRRLAANQVFLIAPAHRDSFDSRYFGPVDRRQIVGRALPLWTWS
jgi:conjugative transfer signal peptidase TraF